MRILHVITSLQYGGAEKLVAEIVPKLQGKGEDGSPTRNTVDVCSFVATEPNLNKVLEEKGIKVINFAGSGSVYKLRFVWKLARLMKNYDIVHTHNYAPQIFAAIAKIMLRGSKGTRPYLVTTEHSTSTRRRGRKIFEWMDKWMYSRYDKIICISEPSEESLRRYLAAPQPPIGGANFPEEKKGKYNICTIKNGVDVRKFMDAEPIDLGLGDCKKITMVAGFRYEKDQSTVIKALKYLPEEYHVVLVGDGAERESLENLVESLELRDRVHFLGLRNDVPNILKSSDVIVMSSHREGLSLSNVEGMAVGKPFIASDVEGLREVTKGYGVLFPHEDSKALAEEIMKLEKEELRNEVAARCMERAKMFDIEKMVEGYLEVYKGLKV